jgi:hypothetical protein
MSVQRLIGHAVPPPPVGRTFPKQLAETEYGEIVKHCADLTLRCCMATDLTFVERDLQISSTVHRVTSFCTSLSPFPFVARKKSVSLKNELHNDN